MALGWARRLACTGATLAVLLGPAAAGQTFSEGYDFLKAVKSRNGDDLTKLVNKPGFQAIDTRDPSSGETALHIVVKRRDMDYLQFLLYKGARTDVRDNEGATPLLDAATIGFVEGEAMLLKVGANPNTPNQSGETPLMRAAQARDADSVRLLLDHGANPAAKDRMTGKTARDYAAQGGRGEAIVKLLDAAKPVKPAFGPHF